MLVHIWQKAFLILAAWKYLDEILSAAVEVSPSRLRDLRPLVVPRRKTLASELGSEFGLEML